MKIVQSYWSKPVTNNDGWYVDAASYMSMTLSCLKLREFYDDIELVTDKVGKELLIDKLDLPYTSVKVCLNEIDNYDSDFWALGKIKAYSIQNRPFIHVDGDVFIWKYFPKHLEESPLLAQHKEDYLYVKDFIINTREKGIHCFDFMNESKEDVTQINAGIIGGHDIDFMQEYSSLAFDLLNTNEEKLNTFEKGDRTMFNTFFEQYLFSSLARKHNKPIQYLLDNVGDSFIELACFASLPHHKSYIHTVGYFKRLFSTGNYIAQRLWFEYPEYYNKIINLLDSRNETN